jgi:signal transduction histidine kinase
MAVPPRAAPSRGSSPRVFFTFAAVVLLFSAAQSQGSRNILFLHMENTHLPDNVIAAKAVEDILGRQPGYQIFDEYMDENRLQGEYSQIADALQRKYSTHKMDLVLTFGPTAFKLAQRYGEKLWPGTPIVFSVVSPGSAKLPPNMTGVAAQYGISKTLDLALQLQPDIRHVFYVGGATPVELAQHEMVARDFKEYEPRLDLTFLDDLPLSKLLARLSQLPGNSVVIYTTFFKDASGLIDLPARICPLIVESSNAPVYGTFNTSLGCGVLGGGVFDVDANVRQAAYMGLRILQGAHVSSLPVEDGPPMKFFVDWRQLKKWNIPESRLPVGTTVLFKEPTVRQRYRDYILAAAVILLTQLGLVILLVIQMRRRKRSDLTVRRLTRRLIHAGEEERRHLARELHDDIGQRLSLVSVQLGSSDRNHSGNRPEGDQKIGEALEELRTVISEIHGLSHRLHSSKLEHLGLQDALKELCQQIAQRHDLEIDLRMNEARSDLDRDVSLCFYRVAQEALSNVVKHSSSSRTVVRLVKSQDALVLQVRDSGAGFDPSRTPVGLGMVTMEERLRMLEGKLYVVSAPGKGTTVTAKVNLAVLRQRSGMETKTTARAASL